MTLAPRSRILFIDDGGVMNDNRLRGPQWERLVGEFMVPRLGGDHAAWAEANRAVIGKLVGDFALRAADYPTYEDMDRDYQHEWLRGMCERVGLPTPPVTEAVALAAEADRWITPRVRADFPGAVDAIRALRAAGYTLHTASGGASTWLEGTLTGMGVRDCFDRLYGPDLIDLPKAGPEYYRRIFAHAGVEPAEVIVIDDGERQCGWATAAGAPALRIAPGLTGATGAESLRALADRLI